MSEPRTSGPSTVELMSWQQVREAFRSKQLRQAGYTEGAVVMAGTLLDATLRPFIERGTADLVQIGYRAAMNLTAQIAGIDIDPADERRTDQLYAIVKKFSEGGTLMHSTRDKDQVRAEVADAVEQFRHEFYAPSFDRRTQLVAAAGPGQGDEELPRDVLTTLLRHDDQLEIAPEVVFREICFYLQAGAHSTANAFTHTVDEMLQWSATNEADPALFDLAFVQRCVHESLRLSPASPVAYRTPIVSVELSDSTMLAAGDRVVLDLTAANCDPDVFGDDADRFDPNRVVPDGVPRWGMSFGGGMHACVGAELDGGLEVADYVADDHLYGTVAVVTHAFLAAGGRSDPDSDPKLDPNSTRKHYSSYPVVFYDSQANRGNADG